MTTITYRYADTAPLYDETRPYDDLSADERAWWDAILARLQAVEDAARELGPFARAEIVAAGEGIADLEASVAAMEAALTEAQRTRYRVSWTEKRNAVRRSRVYVTHDEAVSASLDLRCCDDLTGVEVERVTTEGEASR